MVSIANCAARSIYHARILLCIFEYVDKFASFLSPCYICEQNKRTVHYTKYSILTVENHNILPSYSTVLDSFILPIKSACKTYFSQDASRNAVCHTATVIANSLMHAGTTCDAFLRWVWQFYYIIFF